MKYTTEQLELIAIMFSTLSLPHIPIDDIVKILNFEDNIGEK